MIFSATAQPPSIRLDDTDAGFIDLFAHLSSLVRTGGVERPFLSLIQRTLFLA